MKYHLQPNPQWPNNVQSDVLCEKARIMAWTLFPNGVIPYVTCDATRDNGMLSFLFDITEPESCYRGEHRHNGDPCWQDSCVEVFISSPNRGGYYNFECNSNGVALAEFGSQRQNRSQMDTAFYSAFKRELYIRSRAPHLSIIRWTIHIIIPLDLVGIGDAEPVCGNLYKCASNAQIPHYLMAFPIDTPKPDFHRPEFFRDLFNEKIV